MTSKHPTRFSYLRAGLLRTAASLAVLPIATLMFAATAQAQSQPSSGSGERPQRPPAEALAACKSASKGQACNFTDGGGNKVSGSCDAPQQGIPLACRPADGAGPSR